MVAGFAYFASMRIFVLCTGRTGSQSFIEACRFIDNFSCGHESRRSLLGSDRLDYPPNHIESDNRLSWMLGPLADRFPDDVFYVHLIRDEEATARSFNRRWNNPWSIIHAWAEAVLFRNIRDLTDDEKLQIARDYVRTTNLNIASFLRNKPHLTVRLEHIQEDFRLFWHHIQATGNLEEAIGSLTTPHNTGDENELQKSRSFSIFRKR